MEDKMVRKATSLPESLVREFQKEVANRFYDGNYSQALRDAMRMYIAAKKRPQSDQTADR